MRALVYRAPEIFSLDVIQDPQPVGDQVVVRVERNGVCKTDLHIHHGRFIAQFPLTPGHEFCGTVAATGGAVTGVRTGSAVVCDNTVLCGHCRYCRRNQPLYCENFVSLGCTTAGGLAEYVLVDTSKVFVLPDGIGFDEAAFVEPTACVVHALDRLAMQPGDSVLVFGAGPAGIILAQALRHSAAGRVVVAAPSRFKLEILESAGIDDTVLIERSLTSSDAASIRALAPGGYDVVVDATGSARMVQQAMQFTRRGSKVLIYGACAEEATVAISPYWVFRNEIQIIGTFAQTHCFDRALEMLARQRIRVANLITHRFPLEEYARAISLLADGRTNLKIMMHPNG